MFRSSFHSSIFGAAYWRGISAFGRTCSMKGRAQHHLVSAGMHAVATAAATNIVLAMLDFGTITFADPFGLLCLFG